MSTNHKPLSKKQLEETLIQYRHHFHEYPELANREFKTTETIKAILTKWGIKLLPTNLKTGVFAEIGTNVGPTVALRADIDALPIQEESGVPFSSKVPGVMHACGHDTHIASLLGGAYLLKQLEASLPGKVRLLFQLSEEDKEGALQVINDGQLKGVNAIIGFHNTPHQPIGHVGLRSGITTGAIDKFKVTLTGVGTHASAPQNGEDPIAALGYEITELQSLISRELDPFKAAVLSITHLSAGNTWNVIPSIAFFEGTVRTADKNVRQEIKDRFFKIVNYTALAHNVKADINWYAGDPSVDNDPTLTKIVKDETAKFAPIYVQEQQLGSDDFSCYQDIIPGVYANIGNGGQVSLHNSHFTASDHLLIVGATFFEKNAVRLLKDLKTNHQRVNNNDSL
ncbi:amidohydrolase [Lentilactobacillus hilgardii]|uniref:Amidohydrolase n=1 Tax=Lentilactobacillus hilgardii TaxID=1588 RepID=A0A6P1E602_LENHI|nr:amidohydrolase [Lentilactobacillus hilgardii]RRG12026.1 MAG: amidohydrolase [Lactobacillus sp.]EEI70148.1 amidohydrolase [Lentilactobacillus hilgardii ATCC 27305]MCT3391750.1 amidohydrolase [Lentilactobacillus hilgardii]MCV3740374.1 amidohydrolase [Lentilactobacillus hilgardii]QHB52138.1 amidohydrolase [Lentilactobacillus hilgardii]